MPVNDRPDLGPIPTIPDNLDQPNVFGGITELVKDVFVLELKHFFKANNVNIRDGELPRIDKYGVALDASIDPLETAVNLIRNYPDITENTPLIAVLTTTGQNFKLSIAGKLVGMTIPCASIVGGTGPFALSNHTLELTTHPGGTTDSLKTSLFRFPTLLFADPNSITLDEMVAAINMQALYCRAQKVVVGNENRLGLRAGGPRGMQFPNKIEIVGGTAVDILGFTVGQSDQNYGANKVAYDRHCIAANLTVGLEVVTESDNIRTELSDLLFDFFAFVMADRQCQFYGRSIFSESVLDETYQIIIKDNDITLSGEQEMPRLNDSKDKLYVNRINIPVIAIQYTDRVKTDRSGSIVNPLINVSLISSDQLPEPN